MKNHGQTILDWIEKGKIELAIKHLQKIPDQELGEYQATAFSLINRYKKWEKDRLGGWLSADDQNRQYVQISDALIDLAMKLKDYQPEGPLKILFLAANPKDTGQLRLGQELRDIKEGLKRANHRDNFEIATREAVRPRDLLRALLEEEPVILHFSGHGVSGDIGGENEGRSLVWEEEEDEIFLETYGGGIVLEDQNGKAHIVRAKQISNLIANFPTLQCVVLNACYSRAQVDAFIQHVPVVIGMNTAVSDHAAIEFAVSFYDALAAQSEVDFVKAFRIAKDALVMLAPDSREIPMMEVRS
ncbi:MAG: CHAT domain-containing protein [Bacteroidota bacterium]